MTSLNHRASQGSARRASQGSIHRPSQGSAHRASQGSGHRPSLQEPSHLDHFIGIDVGTGSARACIIDAKGDIVGLASESIGLWQPQQSFYVSFLHI